MPVDNEPLASKECDEFSAEALASWLRAKYARHRELEDLKAAELIERFQQREREAFRLANAATYFVTAERSLHKELLAFMDGQISKPEDYSGFEPRADLETIAAIFQHWLDFDALRWREHCKEEPTDDTIMSRSLLETPRRSVVKAWVAALRRPTQPPPAEQAGCEYSDDGEHECKHCDAKHVTHTAARFIETIWEVTDDCEENAQTGDVTMDQASWEKIMQAIWDLGGHDRERLSNFGWEPSPTKEV